MNMFIIIPVRVKNKAPYPFAEYFYRGLLDVAFFVGLTTELSDFFIPTVVLDTFTF